MKYSTLSKKRLSYDRSFSAFIFSTFYDKLITSLLILLIQAESSYSDVYLNMFYIRGPYPLKERRAKNPGVSLWILPISLVPWLSKILILIVYTELISMAEKNFNEVNPDFFFFFYTVTMAFWHFFFVFSFVVVLLLPIFLYRISCPSNLRRKKGPTDVFGVT